MAWNVLKVCLLLTHKYRQSKHRHSCRWARMAKAERQLIAFRDFSEFLAILTIRSRSRKEGKDDESQRPHHITYSLEMNLREVNLTLSHIALAVPFLRHRYVRKPPISTTPFISTQMPWLIAWKATGIREMEAKSSTPSRDAAIRVPWGECRCHLTRQSTKIFHYSAAFWCTSTRTVMLVVITPFSA
jgi:hypothetical protein